MWKFFVTVGAEGVNLVAAFVVILFAFAVEIEDELELSWQIHYADYDPEMAVFGPDGCGDPCVVTYSEGGWAQAFLNMAAVIHIYERQLIIDGPCASSCAIMADFARPLACITPNASFHFHMATQLDGTRVEPPASMEVVWWIRLHGGFPHDGMLEMGFEEAKHFWPVCEPSGKGDRLAVQ